jgi:hypothetical protein
MLDGFADGLRFLVYRGAAPHRKRSYFLTHYRFAVEI